MKCSLFCLTAENENKPTDCGLPEDPENGYKIGNCTDTQCVLEFDCDLGYTLIGDRNVECLASGEWSAEVPKCDSKWF